MLIKIRNFARAPLSLIKSGAGFIIDLLFPPRCLGCQKEGTYLCEDCKSIIGILESHKIYSTKNLKDLYFAAPYQNPLIKILIRKFKYQPFIKELSKPLASLIVNHFQLIDKKPDFFYSLSPTPKFGGGSNKANFILIPVPLNNKRLKWRGFNQAEEIGKELSKSLKIPLINGVLFKRKETLPQVELAAEAREENIRGAFFIKNNEKIKERKILLVDDVYTTGSTIDECAKVLKKAGAKEILGVTVARE